MIGLPSLRCLRRSSLRQRIHAFIKAKGAFEIVHDRRGRILADHLMGTFDLLKHAHWLDDVCTAGALHSIYGTSIFKRATVEPTPDNRARIAKDFGQRAERLAFYFHACTNRPHGLETGVLTSRATGESIEMDTAELPQHAASSMRPEKYKRWTRLRAAFRQALGLRGGGSFGVKLRCYGQETFVRAPFDTARLSHWLNTATVFERGGTLRDAANTTCYAELILAAKVLGLRL